MFFLSYLGKLPILLFFYGVSLLQDLRDNVNELKLSQLIVAITN